MRHSPKAIAYLVPFLTALATHAGPSDATACTGFRTGVEGRFIMGKSYDWDIGWALVVFNPIGLEKIALTLGGQDTPATWTSQHASITFDQYGCEMPNGGLNDAGLAIELMILGQTQYPPSDDRPAVNELQFIQYCLDNFGSVDEMIEGAALIRISPVHAKVHYLACDSTGICASFEFLGGQMVVATKDSMPAATLTNSTYADSVEYLGQFVGFGGDLAIPQTTSSLDRFVRASSLSVETADGEIPTAAFSILDSVSQGDFSQWNIVYDLEERTIHFRTYTSPARKVIRLDQFNPGCDSGRWILDIDHSEAGDARSAFVPYTKEANAALIDKSLSTIQGLPDYVKAVLALYPDSLECVPPVVQPEAQPDTDAPDGAGDDLVAVDDMGCSPEADSDALPADLPPGAADGQLLDGPASESSTDGPDSVPSKGGCSAGASSAAPSGWLGFVLLLLAYRICRRFAQSR